MKEPGDRRIAASKLIELLAQLPPDSVVVPNDVHNLAVLVDGKYHGFVDLSDETVDLWE